MKILIRHRILSDLDLYFLPMSHKEDAMLIWGKLVGALVNCLNSFISAKCVLPSLNNVYK